MTEIMEKIYSDGFTFSLVIFSIGLGLALIISLPFIIKDIIDERRSIKEAREEDDKTITR